MTPEHIAKHCVAVHVGCPGMNKAVVVFPADNWIGTILLFRLVELALLRDGIEKLAPLGVNGPLNDCVITILAGDREAAIKTIKAELEAAKLLSFCQIAVSDGRAARCIYPSPEVKMAWLLDIERQELYSDQFRQGIDRLLAKSQGEAGDKK
jgi:hypothetical protein